jgi:hypothetical protein
LSIYSGKINQNEVNYAKQSQFPKKSNVYNLNENNELQRKNEIGHLVKTKPILPASAGKIVPSTIEGPIKTTTCLRHKLT